MADISDKIGRRLRELRAAAGLTQEQLAEAAGDDVSAASISRYERGAATPPLQVLDRVVGHLGHDLGSFFSWGDLSRVASPRPLRRIVGVLAALDEEQLLVAGEMLAAHLRGVSLAESKREAVAGRRPPARKGYSKGV